MIRKSFRLLFPLCNVASEVTQKLLTEFRNELLRIITDLGIGWQIPRVVNIIMLCKETDTTYNAI